MLSSPSLLPQLNLAMRSEAGDEIFDFGAVFALLRARLDAYLARAGGGGAADAADDAVRAALGYVQRFNAYALLSGARLAAVDAWQQLVQVRGVGVRGWGSWRRPALGSSGGTGWGCATHAALSCRGCRCWRRARRAAPAPTWWSRPVQGRPLVGAMEVAPTLSLST